MHVYNTLDERESNFIQTVANTVLKCAFVCSLGGQPEQDMVRFSNFLSPGGVKINIVYHDWLDACLKAKKVLPIQDYDALP